MIHDQHLWVPGREGSTAQLSDDRSSKAVIEDKHNKERYYLRESD